MERQLRTFLQTLLAIAAVAGISTLSGNCKAEIIILKCEIAGVSGPIYFTRYSDGSPSRIGVKPGLGDKGLFFLDRTGAQIFVETNTDGAPITLTTIQPDMRAIHARQVLNSDGTVLSPSQETGRCERETAN